MNTQNSIFLPNQITLTPFSDGAGNAPAFFGCGPRLVKYIKEVRFFKHAEMMATEFLTVRVEPSFPEDANRLIAVKFEGLALDKAEFVVGIAPDNFGWSKHIEFGEYSNNIGVSVSNGHVYVKNGCDKRKGFTADFVIPPGTQNMTIGVAVYYNNDQNFCQFYIQDAEHRMPITFIKLVKKMKLVVCSKTPGLSFTLTHCLKMGDKDFEDTDQIVIFRKKNIDRHISRKERTKQKAEAERSSKAEKNNPKDPTVLASSIEEVVDLPDSDGSRRRILAGYDDADDADYVDEGSEDDDNVYVDNTDDDQDMKLAVKQSLNDAKKDKSSVVIKNKSIVLRSSNFVARPEGFSNITTDSDQMTSNDGFAKLVSKATRFPKQQSGYTGGNNIVFDTGFNITVLPSVSSTVLPSASSTEDRIVPLEMVKRGKGKKTSTKTKKPATTTTTTNTKNAKRKESSRMVIEDENGDIIEEDDDEYEEVIVRRKKQ